VGTHGFPTTNFGASCTSFGSPFIVNCNYDGAQQALVNLFGNIKPKGNQLINNA
jgi:hypothetical protein